MIKDKQDFIDMIKSFMGQASILTIPKELIHYCEGDINSALLLSQLIYWQDKIKNKEGWIYKTYKDWEDEICLNEYHIRKARKYLEKGYGIESRELYDCLEDKKIEELSAEAIRQQVSEQSQPRAQIGQKG